MGFRAEGVQFGSCVHLTRFSTSGLEDEAFAAVKTVSARFRV